MIMPCLQNMLPHIFLTSQVRLLPPAIMRISTGHVNMVKNMYRPTGFGTPAEKIFLHFENGVGLCMSGFEILLLKVETLGWV